MTSNSNENTILDDANSPEINTKLMGEITEDFIKVSDHIKEASYQIRKRGFSMHPIFVVARSHVQLGQLLFANSEMGNSFDYKASMLDEFIQRNLIGEESEGLFKENYKNPEEYACLFVISGDFAGFVYIPYPED